jgi:nucleotide-binding universal stress UspA family protein
MLSRILVPLDGSPLAEAVIPQVAELAALRKAEVVLLRVALAHTLPGADPVAAQVRAVDEAEAYLLRVERDLVARGLPVVRAVRYGRPAEEILDHARVGGVSLIAMSTHGRTGIRRWVLGSVAEQVARRSPVPVLLWRATEPEATSAGAARPGQVPTASAPDGADAMRIRHILCPVDLTTGSREIMQTAAAVAARFGADLTVLHAVYDPLDVTCSHIPHPPLEQLREEMIRVAEDTLRRHMRKALGPNARPTMAVVAGKPFRQIVRYAQRHQVDLIVMGTAGRTGLDHAIMGSTAERVVRTAHCPVFSVRIAA